MSESVETTPNALQLLQGAIADAVEGTVITIEYVSEAVEPKNVTVENVVALTESGITYLEAETEIVDAWSGIAKIGVLEPTDVVETDV